MQDCNFRNCRGNFPPGYVPGLGHCTRARFTLLPRCQAVMRLRFGHVRSFACRDKCGSC